MTDLERLKAKMLAARDAYCATEADYYTAYNAARSAAARARYRDGRAATYDAARDARSAAVAAYDAARDARVAYNAALDDYYAALAAQNRETDR